MSDTMSVDNSEPVMHDPAMVFHSWSAQAALAPLELVSAQGVHVQDAAGRDYLDFSSMLVNVNIGHQHPRVIQAIKGQADALATVGPAFGSRVRGEAARLILERAPGGFGKVFFTNGGADANENAIRMARLTTGRMPNEFARGHAHFFGPYAYRSEFWSDSPEQESERALQHLRRIIEAEGPATIAAVLLETIPGTAGILPPPPGYLAGVRELTHQHGIVMILDEVMAGFGRTGAWLALDNYGVVPDLITFAKGVNSGYVPVGGVMISEPIAKAFDERVFPGGLTYSGHPLAMGSIVGALTAMADEGIVENAARIGTEVLGPGLAALAEESALIGEVRGLGVFWAMELVADKETRAPLPADRMARIKSGLIGAGMLPFVQDNRIHVVPPCVITDDEARAGLAIYREVLAANA